MTERRQSAKAYLDRHLEPVSDSSYEYSRLTELLMEERRQFRTYSEDAISKAELIAGDNCIRYEYKEVDDLPAQLTKNGLLRFIKENPHKYRELTKATIQNAENEAFLDLLAELPPGWRAFLDVYTDSGDVCYPLENVVLISRRIDSSDRIYALAHEIGHARDIEANPMLNQELIFESNNSYHARMLESERNAHAFALNKLRPFLSTEPGETLSHDMIREVVVHKVCLGSYSNHIRIEQQKPLHTLSRRVGRTAAAQTIAFLSKGISR